MIEKVDSYKTAVYCRLSSDDASEGESGSIQTQKALLTQYCHDNNYPVHDYYIDDGWSGTNFNRPDFIRMINDVENGVINLVIVKDLSRFGREYAEMGMYIDNVFDDYNVRFIALGENIDTLKGTDGLIMPITNVINSHYAKECSRKTKEAHRALARQGKFIGSHAPYGYIKDPSDRHHLLLDPEAAAVVKRIFDDFANGIGYVRITKRLREDNVLNPQAYFNRNNPDFFKSEYWRQDFDWHATSIRAILENPVYLGCTCFGRSKTKGRDKKKKIMTEEDDWIVVPDMHEAIIEQHTWDVVHDLMKNKRRETKAGEVQIFSGLIKCADCGSSLNLSGSGDKKKGFSCWVYKNYGKERCTSHAIGYKTLYNLVLDDIRRQAQNARVAPSVYIEQLSNQEAAKRKRELSATKAEQKRKDKRSAELNTILNKLYEDYALGKIAENRYSIMAEKYNAELNAVTADLEALGNTITAIETRSNNINSFLEIIVKYTDLKELDARILNELIEKIVVHEKRKFDNTTFQCVEIYYRFIGLVG